MLLRNKKHFHVLSWTFFEDHSNPFGNKMAMSKRQIKKKVDVENSTDSRMVPHNNLGSPKLRVCRYRYIPSSATGKFKKASSKPRCPSPSLHVCHECNKGYQNSKSLTIHMSRFHKTKPGAKCPECPKVLSNKSSITKHLLTHRPRSEWPFQCPLCFRRFQAMHDVPKHFATSAHRGDPRIPEWPSKEWTELLQKCRVSPSSANDSHVPQKSTASESTKRTSKRKTSIMTASNNVPCVSNIQVSRPKEALKNLLQQQKDEASEIMQIASNESSQVFPIKQAQPIPSSSSSATSGKLLSNSVQNNLTDYVVSLDHLYAQEANINNSPEPSNADPQIVNPSQNTTKTYVLKRTPPKILPKVIPDASPSMVTTQNVSQTSSSYKLVKILGRNSTVIQQLLVPSNSQIYYMRQPSVNAVPNLSNIPITSQKETKKLICPRLSKTPKQMVKLQYTSQVRPMTLEYSNVPATVEKMAYFSNDVIKP